jgi:hypothetical protein
MRPKDDTRLKLWLQTAMDNPKYRTKEVMVEDVGAEGETEYGLCQAIEIWWAEGHRETINYFYNDPAFAVPEDFKGKIKMRIKWMGDYWKGELSEPLPPKEDWGFIQHTVDKQTMIVRQSSIRSAVELLKEIDHKQDTTKQALAIAKKFENYVMG